jgi:hypothetical protein
MDKRYINLTIIIIIIINPIIPQSISILTSSNTVHELTPESIQHSEESLDGLSVWLALHY